MTEEPRDDPLARRLERHFDRARLIQADVSGVTRARSRGVARLHVAATIGALVAVIVAVSLASQLIGSPGPRTGSAVPPPTAVPSGGATVPSVSASQIPEPGCLPPEMPYADPDFTPVAGRFGPLTPPPLREMGRVLGSVDDIPEGFRVPSEVPEGLSLRLILAFEADPPEDGPPPFLRLFYSDEPVPAHEADFLARGGVVVTQLQEHLWDAASLAAQFDASGRGYSLVRIGPHQAIASLADPIVRDDLRPWHVYWHDGSMDWSIMGIADPIALIEMGQSLYCP